MKIGTENHNELGKLQQGNVEALSGLKNESTVNEGLDNENQQFEGDLLLTLDERKVRLVEIEQSAPQLILEVVNKINLPLGAKIKITSTGISNSMRDEKDGIVFFGCYNGDPSDKKVRIIINTNI